MSDTLTRPMVIAPNKVNAWTGYATLLRWNLNQIGPMLPLIIVLQAVLAAGMIVGFGLLSPSLDEATMMFLSTGAPTVLLLLVGLVVVPQAVAMARNNGSFQYTRTLPVPRPMVLLSELTSAVIVAIPSIFVALLVARWHYDVAFSIDWPVLFGAAVLVAVMGSAVGYALAVTFPPMLAQILSQVLIFFVMLFSPVNYPATQLPEWFQRLHHYLPIEAGAKLIRAGMASEHFQWTTRDLVVLAIWTAVGIVLSMRALSRRS